MGSWEVTEQAVAALGNMAVQLEELTQKIHQETERMKAVFEANRNGLGAHVMAIQNLIEDVEATEEDATKPVKKLVLKLQRAALVRQKHIDTNRYTKEMGRTR